MVITRGNTLPTKFLLDFTVFWGKLTTQKIDAQMNPPLKLSHGIFHKTRPLSNFVGVFPSPDFHFPENVVK